MFGIKSLIASINKKNALVNIKFEQFERVLNEVHYKIFQKTEKAIPVSDPISTCSCEDKFDSILEILREIQCDNDQTEEHHPLNSIQDKLNTLLKDENRIASVKLAEATLDKFDDNMKNVDKLNTMVNEIKGVAALARAGLHDKNMDGLNGCMRNIIDRMESLETSINTVEVNMIDRFEFNKLVNKIKKTPLKKEAKR
jgi:hypothetical protein